MELTRTGIEAWEEEELKRELDEKLKSDLVIEKRHQNWVYQLLKYNPIDPINDFYRYIIKELNLEKMEGRLQWWAAYFYVKLACRALWNLKVEYPKKNLFPEYGPGILVSTHVSHLDPFFCGAACHRRIRWMSKLENFKTPIVRTLFSNLGAFKLDRDNPTLGWEFAKDIIRGGEWVGIFPEGTRSVDGELGEFKTGAVRLALEMKVPIVPMAVIGSENALPKGKLVMKPTQVIVRVGDPIYFDNYDTSKLTYNDVKRLTNEVRTAVYELKEGIYGKPKEELSIGSPEDLEKKPSFNIKRFAKDFGKGLLWTIDDIWYGWLRSLEEFGAREKVQEYIYSFSGFVVHHWCQLMAPYKVIDFEKYIPKMGPGVLCTNHNSEWDVIMLATSIIYNPPRRIIYQMSKQSLFQIPIVNAWVRNHHAFPLKRGLHDVDSFNFAKDLLDKGHLVTVYPEGTTNTGNGELLDPHVGAMRLAIEKQVPIILVGITGTEDTYPKHAKMLNFYRGNIFKAGPPFMEHRDYWGKQMPDYDELKRLSNNMMAQIKDLLLYDEPDA